MTEFAQLLVKGVALGGVYAIVALGFVVVFKSTGVINFAQGSLMLLGAYLTYAATAEAGLPFPIAVAVAAMGAVALGLLTERLVLRRMVGQPPVTVIMATIGLAIVIDHAVTAIWGFGYHSVGDPWGAGSVTFAGITLSEVDVATIVITAAVVAALAGFFNGTRLGLGLRATASDPEAALAVGISPALVARTAWAVTALVATFAGVLLASGPGSANPGLGDQALRAFPAVVLGGFASLGGAVAGGVIIGVIEVLAAGYAPRYAPWLGTNAYLVAPYAVMLIVLAVRPHGLFGASPAQRI